MATKYYAWSPIHTMDKVVEPGTVVTRTDFPDWDQLVDSGAVKTKVYPKIPKTYQGSPRNFRLDQLKKLREDIDFDITDELDQLELEDSEQ